MITGSLESITRSEAEDLIKRHSGRITGSVSGKTTFLVAGQDSGTRKVATVCAALQLSLNLICVEIGNLDHIPSLFPTNLPCNTLQAKEKGVRIIDEDGLFSLINAAPAPDAPPEEAAAPMAVPTGALKPPHSAPSPGTGHRRMPASFSGRAAPTAPAAPSTSHAGVQDNNGGMYNEGSLNC